MSLYEQFFSDADKDSDGYITFEELTAMLRRIGYKDSDDKILAMFGSVDTSGDQKISLDEFLIAMGDMSPTNFAETMMRSTFRSFDKDGSGKIDKKELQQAMKECGSHLTDDEINRLVQLVDKDGSGTLDYEEFLAYCYGK